MKKVIFTLLLCITIIETQTGKIWLYCCQGSVCTKTLIGGPAD